MQIISRIRRLKILEEHDRELSVKNQQKMKQVKKERKTALGIEACTRKRERILKFPSKWVLLKKTSWSREWGEWRMGRQAEAGSRSCWVIGKKERLGEDGETSDGLRYSGWSTWSRDTTSQDKNDNTINPLHAYPQVSNLQRCEQASMDYFFKSLGRTAAGLRLPGGKCSASPSSTSSPCSRTEIVPR